MGLLEKLGLPSKAPVAPAAAAPAAVPAPAKAPALRATVILYNASDVPLVIKSSEIGGNARFETQPPATVKPNARATFRVVDKADIDATAGQVVYANEGAEDKATVTFSWSGRAGEIGVVGQGRYATTSRYREDAQSGREYLLVYKETRKVRGPVLDALDEDLERVEGELQKERADTATTAGSSSPADAPAPAADAPAAEAPAADTPEADAPSGDAASTDAPSDDAPSADAPPADAPSADAPDGEASPADGAGADARPATDAPPGGATPEFAGVCKITLANHTGVTLRLTTSHLDNDKAHFGVPPPDAVPAGRSAPFVAWSRDAEHPEIGGFAKYAFKVEPPPEDNPEGEFELQLAWSGSRAGSHISPASKTFDVESGGAPGAFVFTVTGPAIEFAPPPKQTSQPTLRKGDKSPDGWVEYLQQLLNLQNDAGLEVDGAFGGLTRTAVVAYQRKLKKKDPAVLDDGVVGDQTWSYLRDGAPAKPATDKRQPHTYVERGVEARWESETGALVYHEDRDIATLMALSVGDADQLAGRTARFRITSPSRVQKVVEALIGKGEKSSKSGQGYEHLVTVESFSDLWDGGGRAAAGDYAVEAYFPGDLGGDTYAGSLTILPRD